MVRSIHMVVCCMLYPQLEANPDVVLQSTNSAQQAKAHIDCHLATEPLADLTDPSALEIKLGERPRASN